MSLFGKFISFFLILCGSFLYAQEIGSDGESSGPQSEDVRETADSSVSDGEKTAETDSDGGKSADDEVEISRDIGVSFNIGSIVTYDNERMHDFHSQWFGWYPEFLIFLGLDLPSGIKDMNLTLSGLNIGKFENSFRFRWGGGVEFIVYKGGPDGRAIQYSEDYGGYADFWTEQEEKRIAGLDYVESGYDRAFADWGFDWIGGYSFGKNDSSDISILVGYSGRWGKFLQDYKDETIQYLFDTDYPDRDMYLLNKLTASFSYSFREEFDERFSHGLFNEVGTGVSLDIAPAFMNPSITGEFLPLKNSDGSFVYDADGNKLFSGERAYTADYYRFEWKVFGRRKLFDVAPERKSVLFTGHLRWGASLRYTDYLGDEGYIPLDARMEIRDDSLFGRRDDVLTIREYTRSVAVNTSMELVLGLPQIKIEDLKTWTPPETNAGWGKVEDSFGRTLRKFGVEPNAARWNQTNLIDPTLTLRMGTAWIKQLQESPGNRYQTFYIDQPSWLDIDFVIDLNVRVFDILNLGLVFEFELEHPRFNEFWFRFG